MTLLATGAETAGSFALIESAAPHDTGRHLHEDEDEAFYVLDGTFEFMIGDETISAEQGAFVRVPNGAVHAFSNVGAAPGRLLIINSPGRAHDGFFSEAGDLMPPGTRDLPPPSGPPDIPRLLEIGRRNGLEFLLPAGDH